MKRVVDSFLSVIFFRRGRAKLEKFKKVKKKNKEENTEWLYKYYFQLLCTEHKEFEA